MTLLQIQLLGGFTVSIDDQPITKFRSAKSRALLAYVAVQPDRAHPRATIATLLWGELPEKAAKTNLRVELSALKKTLQNHPALEISRQTVRFNSKMGNVDAIALQKGIEAFTKRPFTTQSKHLNELENGITLYKGEFLSGFHLADAVEFDDWQRGVQEQLHEQVMAALTLLQQRYREQGNWAALAAAARRQLAIAPWLEAAHRCLMQALAAQGQRRAAMTQYATCRAILQEELGVEPALATREIMERVKNGRFSPVTATHNLPPQLKTFVGRDNEIVQLHELVQSERLVTVMGLGGVGKSRLTQAVGYKALYAFTDGVWFVPLAAIESVAATGLPANYADQIAIAIASAIGFHITNMQSPLAELAAFLAGKQMLLILDNWEHLIAAAEGVVTPLLHQSDVHILATSRLRLGAEGERPFPLRGLPLADATTLFINRARQLLPDFLPDGEMDDIAAVCRQVDGLPLGIELAASWVEHFSVAEIGQSLSEIEAAPQQAAKLDDRHHSLNTVFAYSWRLLNPHQQRIWARMSLFHGGFDRAAATAVSDSSLSDLSILISHSLIQRVSAGRYDLHPLAREFATRKRSQAEETALLQKHSVHYLTILAAMPREERNGRLRPDFENVRCGWQTAVSHANAVLIGKTAVQFSEFISQFGLMADGYVLFETAVFQFSPHPTHNELTALLLDQQWLFSRTLHGIEIASALQKRLLTLTNNEELQVKTHTELANRYAEEGQWKKADAHFDQAESIARNTSDLHLYINAVEGRIHINALHFRGDFGAGIGRLQEMMALIDNITPKTEKIEDLRFTLLKSLNLVATRYGDYALAIHIAERDLDWVSKLGNRQYKVWVLLDIGLAQQFAGMYTQAIARQREALAIAEEIGAADDIGLLKANLCLTMRQSGDLEAGLAYGLAAIETLRPLRLARMEGQARNRVGHILAALGRWEQAYAAYGEALHVWQPLHHPNQMEAAAGRAAAALMVGKRDEAAALAAEVLAFTQTKGVMGIVEPVLLLLNLAHVLSEVGRENEAAFALQQAREWVQMIAGRISETAVCDSFRKRPDNLRLLSPLKKLGFCLN